MEHRIIIRKSDYIENTEEDYVDKLKIDFHRTSFSTYDPFKTYLHVQVGDYNEFNLYVEMDECQMEKLIKQLQEQITKAKYGF